MTPRLAADPERLKAPTARQLERQREHVRRARASLWRALDTAEGPENVFVMRALTELAEYLKRGGDR